MPLPDLSLGEWLMIVAASWAILAAVVAVPIGRAMRRADRDVVPVDPPTQFLPFRPPVPPSRRATDDWMALVPVECLSDDEIGLRCADIEAREGWWAA